MLTAADDQLNALGWNVSDFHACKYLVNVADYPDSNLSPSDFNKSDIMSCNYNIDNVTEVVESLFKVTVLLEYIDCAEVPSYFLRYIDLCDIAMVQTTSVRTYKISWSEEDPTNVCKSFLSYCVPHLNQNKGACLIGERNLVPFQFEGETFEDYLKIKNLCNVMSVTIKSQG